jgi:hypothetical protein
LNSATLPEAVQVDTRIQEKQRMRFNKHFCPISVSHFGPVVFASLVYSSG